MPLIDLDYGEAALALGFLKLLRKQLPNSDEMMPKAREVASWLYAGSTDEEQSEMKSEGLIGT